LQRWLAVTRNPTASASFRAGWARLARLVRPRLREWEARWWRAVHENELLRSRIGSQALEISRLHDLACPPDDGRSGAR
jgi:hypothetical protein